MYDDCRTMGCGKDPVGTYTAVAGVSPNAPALPPRQATGEVCQEVNFQKTINETAWSTAKPYGMDGGETYPIGTKRVTINDEREFCQDVYESDVFEAHAQLQATINGYAQKNNFNIVSQRDVVFDPCDRSWFGNALLWIGGVFGSDALDMTNKYCGGNEEVADSGNDFSFTDALNRSFEMQRETREMFRKSCDEGNWTGCFNLASYSSKL